MKKIYLKEELMTKLLSQREPGKRGRKKKDHILANNENYLACHLEIINNKNYLVDSDDNVYTYNIEYPKYLGKLSNIKINE